MKSTARLYGSWLAVGSAYGIVAGLCLIALSLFPNALGLDAVTNALFWPREGDAEPVTAAAREAVAVSGALTSGWSVMVWSLRPLLVAGSPVVARAVVRGFVCWFVLDSAACILIGGVWNIVGNVSFLLAIAVPAFALARQERGAAP